MAIELPCYTIINIPQDQEQPSEQKLKEDLEKGDIKVIIFKSLTLFLPSKEVKKIRKNNINKRLNF